MPACRTYIKSIPERKELTMAEVNKCHLTDAPYAFQMNATGIGKAVTTISLLELTQRGTARL